MEITTNTNNTYYAVLNTTEQAITPEMIAGQYHLVDYILTLYVGNNAFNGYTIGYDVRFNNNQVAYHTNSGNQTSMSRYSSKTVISGTARVDGNITSMPITVRIFTDNIYYLPVELNGSGTMTLTALHTPPQNVQYTITETNQDLIDAGISDNVFVKGLSQKEIAITCDLYDDATVETYYVFNHISRYQNATSPVTIDFTQNDLVFDETQTTKVPIRVGVLDSLGGEGASSLITNPDLYDGILYNKISIINANTYTKRKGQTSGRVNLNVSGNYYNGVIGNKDQSNTYKPTIKYKFWKYGTSEPSTYDYQVPAQNITISNGTFSVVDYDIGSSTETDTNYFDPDYAYRVKVFIEDNFIDDTSSELSIPIGEPTWTEYRDRVDFKKITVGGYNPFEYSTSETVVGTWIDGSKVYQTAISTNTPSGTNAETTILTGVDLLLDYFQTVSIPSDNVVYPNNFDAMQIYVRNNNVILKNKVGGSYWNNQPIYIVLIYTKP